MERLLTILVTADWEMASVKIFAHRSYPEVAQEFCAPSIESAMSKMGAVLDSERKAEEG